MMGMSAALMLPGIAGVCSYIILSGDFRAVIEDGASGALLVDVLGAVIMVWRLVMTPGGVRPLEPLTTTGTPEQELPAS
jgi:hypothetical protein